MKDLFSRKELFFICVLGSALGIRQMTMVIPFMSIYGETLKYNTPVLIGLSLGIFGLMQAILKFLH